MFLSKVLDQEIVPTRLEIVDLDVKHQTQKQNSLLERAVDGAPTKIPTLFFFTPPAPQVPPLGHDLDDRMQISFDICYIFHL